MGARSRACGRVTPVKRRSHHRNPAPGSRYRDGDLSGASRTNPTELAVTGGENRSVQSTRDQLAAGRSFSQTMKSVAGGLPPKLRSRVAH